MTGEETSSPELRDSKNELDKNISSQFQMNCRSLTFVKFDGYLKEESIIVKVFISVFRSESPPRTVMKMMT